MKKAIVILCAAIVAATLSATAFAAPSYAATLSCNDALKIALKDAGLKKTQVTHIEKDRKKSTVEIEFTRKKTGTEYEYTVARNGGVILSKEIEYVYKHTSSKAKIGKTAALKKVAKFSGIPYSTVKKAKCTYRYQKNEGTYKVQFNYKGFEREFKLLAPSGKIIEWEKERLGKLVAGSAV